MSHADKIKDADAYFEVNPITRQIINKTPAKVVLMQGDHNSESFTFSLPRYIEGHDMAESAKTKVHYINASKGYDGRYDVKDLRIDPDNPENVICSWLISGNVTKEAGALVFLIEFDCYEGDVLVYSWHTQQHKGISIGETFDCSEELAEMYADVLQQWENELFSANAEGVKNIATAKADALGSIESARTKAISDIENTNETETAEAINKIVTKGRETLESIPDDYVALDAKVEQSIALSDKTRIINNSKGSMHALSDSAEAPLQGMKIFGKTKQATTTGKNKLRYPYHDTNKTYNGITFTDNGDGTITVNGTATATSYYNFAPADNIIPILSGSYILSSGVPNDSATKTIGCYLALYDPETLTRGTPVGTVNGSVTVTVEKDTYFDCNITIRQGFVANNLVIKPMIRPANTDNTWEPFTGGMPSPNPSYPQALESVGDDGSVEQFVYGQNLIDYTKCKGITENDKSFILDGDTFVFPAGKTYFGLDLSNAVRLVKGQTYRTFYKAVTSYAYPEMKITYVDGTYISRHSNKVITIDKDVKAIVFYIGANTLAETDFTLSKLQIKAGDIDNGYEYPKQPQSLTIPTPNGLPGIPVSSGGNYTDENGQQWISDEIDLERGVYVQRIGEHIFDGTENFSIHSTSSQNKNGINTFIWQNHWSVDDNIYPVNSIAWSNHYLGYLDDTVATATHPSIRQTLSSAGKRTIYIREIYLTSDEFKAELARRYAEGTPTIVKYYLPPTEWVETLLSEEEIEAYKALHTNYPNTTIYNDEGAYTEVKYVADTKNYVDNKIANEVAKLQAATE